MSACTDRSSAWRRFQSVASLINNLSTNQINLTGLSSHSSNRPSHYFGHTAVITRLFLHQVYLSGKMDRTKDDSAVVDDAIAHDPVVYTCKDEEDEGFVAKDFLQRACRICHESTAPHASRSPVFLTEKSFEEARGAGGAVAESSPGKGRDDYELIAPCQCRGTIKWVHRMCLDGWRSACYRTEAYRRCEQCGADYQLEDGWAPSIGRSRWMMHVLAMCGMALWGALSALAIEGGRDFGSTLVMDSFLRDLQHSYTRAVRYQATLDGDHLYAVGKKYHPSAVQQDARPVSSWRALLLEAALGIALTEILVINVYVPLVVNLAIVLVRTFGFSEPTSFDWSVLAGTIVICLYFAYSDMLRGLHLLIRRWSCTRIRNLAENPASAT